ncbi:MAG: pilus assembly protein [Acidobacteriia bacterium]|nr:pilus assembly protein [Terriglobia bacterium]
MQNPGTRREARRRGHAALELALLSPWIFFLFAGTLDMGFYAYALISTQNAARVAVEYTSKAPGTSADSDGACRYALAELSGMGNLRGVTTCGATPLIVTAQKITADFDGVTASAVTVTYRTPMLIPIPGLPGQLTVKRTVQMRTL